MEHHMSPRVCRQSGLWAILPIFACIWVLHFAATSPKNLFQETVELLSGTSEKLDTYDVVIVGAGLSGAVVAQRFAEATKWRILVIDRRHHIGGNCFDEIDPKSGIRVQRYGAHLFHTNNERVWKYVRRFSHWSRWEHRVLALVNNSYVTFPINFDTINSLFHTQIEIPSEMEAWLNERRVYVPTVENSRDAALTLVGNDLYEIFFKHYTKKQWDKDPSELDKSVLQRIPVRLSNDDRYFSDKYQALPTDGYTAFFANLLNSTRIDVLLKVDFDDIRHHLSPNARVIFTGRIDTYFREFGLEPLEYRSLKFHYEYHDTNGYVQPVSVVNFPQPDTRFTRAVEFKHFLHQQGTKSVIVKEVSSDVGDPYYPVLSQRNMDLYGKYAELASLSNATFVGRLATYKYYNMDQAILAALNVADKILYGTKKDCDMRIVMARYNEDLYKVFDNIQAVRSALGCVNAPVFLYNKGNDDPHPPWTNVITHRLNNIGREGHTFLHHIVNTYGDFGGKTIFLQADVHELHRIVEFLSKILFPNTGFLPLNDWRKENILADQVFYKKSVDAIYSLMFEDILRYDPSTFWAAQFVVSNARIERHPKWKYQKLLDIFELPPDHPFWNPEGIPVVKEWDAKMWGGKDEPSSPVFGHSMERAWSVIFECDDDRFVLPDCEGENRFKEETGCQCLDS